MMSGGRMACMGSYEKYVEASDGRTNFATKLVKPQDKTKKGAKAKQVEKVEESKKAVGNDDHEEQRMAGVVKHSTFLNYS